MNEFSLIFVATVTILVFKLLFRKNVYRNDDSVFLYFYKCYNYIHSAVNVLCY